MGARITTVDTDTDTDTRLQLGAWLARAKDTVYQAATDGFVVAFEVTQNIEITCFTDGSNPPATKRAHQWGSTEGSQFCMPVKSGDYWEANIVTGTLTVYWIPLEILVVRS